MILPAASATTAEYWQAAQAGRLLLRYCDDCGTWLHPRRTHCPRAHSLSWRESQGTGTLLAHAVVERALATPLREHVPYTLTLTRLAEGPQLLTAIPGRCTGLACGMRMRATFERVSASVTLPRFVPDPAAQVEAPP